MSRTVHEKLRQLFRRLDANLVSVIKCCQFNEENVKEALLAEFSVHGCVVFVQGQLCTLSPRAAVVRLLRGQD